MRGWGFLLVCAILAPACGGGGGGGGNPVTFTGVGTPATTVKGDGSVPPGLSANFELGVANFDTSWGGFSTAAFGFRSQYLSGGVNTGSGWTTWNSPPGQFASLYITASGAMISVFDYYQLRGSAPNVGSENPDPKLQNPDTMTAYYTEFKLLVQKCAASGKIVILHVEPDFWGFCESVHGPNPETIPVCVANTGFPEAVGLNDNLCGFAQLLVKIRDTYEPQLPGTPHKVLIAPHASHWGSGADLIKNKVDPATQANAIGGYFTKLGATFDLLFHDPADRDAGYNAQFDGGASWWAAGDFDRYRQYLGDMKSVTGLRNILWQVPIGNTKTATCNNTNWHFQDNRVEFWLDDTPHANVGTFATAGVIAILWGAPQGGCTHYDDSANDGKTPAAEATTDDDGGYLRTRAAAYYSTTSPNPGPIPLP
jgi:hypothetical protein